MDRSVEYGQVMSNFTSAYNTGIHRVHHPTIYVPVSPSASFSSQQIRSHSKFNLDLYNPNEYSSESFDYLSPSESVIIHHHHPVYSPSHPSPSEAISKLRQLNDELCYTLAQCDLNTQSPSPAPHHHVHHYPISRSPSPKEQDSSSIASEPISRRRNARITYKAHVPRRKNPLDPVDQMLVSTSDVYAPDEALTVDLYPTNNQGFVRRIRNRPDNQSPWLADTSPIRRNSYSESSTYRTPRAPYYDDGPIEPNSRLATGKRVRPRSSSGKSRAHRSTDFFASSAPVWRPSGSIKRRKFIGSHAPPSKPKATLEPVWNPAGSFKAKSVRAWDPVRIEERKAKEPVWHPPSETKAKVPKYFEPNVKPELILPVEKQTAFLVSKRATIRHDDPKIRARIANAESKVEHKWDEPPTTLTRPKLNLQRQSTPPIQKKTVLPVSKKVTIRSGDPKLKARIANAESKIENRWNEPPGTRTKSKPPTLPRPTTETKTPKPRSAPPPAPIKTDTGRSSLNDVPSKPMFHSTPRTRSVNEDPEEGLVDAESQISEPSPKPTTPPKTTVPEPDRGTKATIKNGVLVHGDDIDKRTPSPEIDNRDEEEGEESRRDQSLLPSPIPPPTRKEPSPLPDHRDDVSVIDDEDIRQSREDTPEHSAMDETIKDPTPPHREEPLPSTSPAPASTTHDAAADFFD